MLRKIILIAGILASLTVTLVFGIEPITIPGVNAPAAASPQPVAQPEGTTPVPHKKLHCYPIIKPKKPIKTAVEHLPSDYHLNTVNNLYQWKLGTREFDILFDANGNLIQIEKVTDDVYNMVRKFQQAQLNLANTRTVLMNRPGEIVRKDYHFSYNDGSHSLVIRTDGNDKIIDFTTPPEFKNKYCE